MNSGSDNRSKVILGVDDNQENLGLLRLTVEAAGYFFVGVPDGASCLTQVARLQPRLILLDVQMPGMDGYETCAKLRANREWQAIPVAFLTARKTREDVREGMKVGGNDFIVKPFNRDHLLSRIQHWTSRRIPVDPNAAAA